MKRLSVAVFVCALGIALASCGSSRLAKSYSGTWSSAAQRQFVANCTTANPSLSGIEITDGCGKCLIIAEKSWPDFAAAKASSSDLRTFYEDDCGLPAS